LFFFLRYTHEGLARINQAGLFPGTSQILLSLFTAHRLAVDGIVIAREIDARPIFALAITRVPPKDPIETRRIMLIIAVGRGIATAGLVPPITNLASPAVIVTSKRFVGAAGLLESCNITVLVHAFAITLCPIPHGV
jgi:hypothetical protein